MLTNSGSCCLMSVYYILGCVRIFTEITFSYLAMLFYLIVRTKHDADMCQTHFEALSMY